MLHFCSAKLQQLNRMEKYFDFIFRKKQANHKQESAMRNRTHIGKTKSADASITHYIYKNFVSSTKFTIFARHIIKREKRVQFNCK